MKKQIFAIGIAGLLLTACECCDTPETPISQISNEEIGAIDSSSIDYFIKNVGDKVYFDFDKSSVRSDQSSLVQKQAEWLSKNCQYKIVVAGHCDERGTSAYNMALGERRANSVKSVLVAAGVDANRVSICSYGKDKPLVEGNNEESWSLNRVAITTLHDAQNNAAKEDNRNVVNQSGQSPASVEVIQ